MDAANTPLYTFGGGDTPLDTSGTRLSSCPSSAPHRLSGFSFSSPRRQVRSPSPSERRLIQRHSTKRLSGLFALPSGSAAKSARRENADLGSMERKALITDCSDDTDIASSSLRAECVSGEPHPNFLTSPLDRTSLKRGKLQPSASQVQNATSITPPKALFPLRTILASDSDDDEASRRDEDSSSTRKTTIAPWLGGPAMATLAAGGTVDLERQYGSPRKTRHRENTRAPPQQPNSFDPQPLGPAASNASLPLFKTRRIARQEMPILTVADASAQAAMMRMQHGDRVARPSQPPKQQAPASKGVRHLAPVPFRMPTDDVALLTDVEALAAVGSGGGVAHHIPATKGKKRRRVDGPLDSRRETMRDDDDDALSPLELEHRIRSEEIRAEELSWQRAARRLSTQTVLRLVEEPASRNHSSDCAAATTERERHSPLSNTDRLLSGIFSSNDGAGSVDDLVDSLLQGSTFLH